MVQLDKVTWAWLAGLFEGEACFTFNGKSGHARLAINSTDRDVIEFICKTFNVNISVRPSKKAEWKEAYQTQICRQSELQWIARNIYHLLSKRRREALDKWFASWDLVPPDKPLFVN